MSTRQNLYDVLAKTIAATQQQSMSTNETQAKTEPVTGESLSSSKTKRAHYMSQLRGENNSEYRRIERENNARAMRRKRSENPIYREQERRQNRAHMAEMRRDNPEYRQKEHVKNRHRMAVKRRSLSQSSTKTSPDDRQTDIHSSSTTSINESVITSIYQTLENNLQSAHISFIPYQTACSFPSNVECQEKLFNTNHKRRTEYEFLKQVDEYCRQQETASSTESFSRSAGSSSSSC